MKSHAWLFDAAGVKGEKAGGLSDQTLTGPLTAAAERSSSSTFHPVIPGTMGLSIMQSTPSLYPYAQPGFESLLMENPVFSGLAHFL